jgi:hypothetical protein
MKKVLIKRSREEISQEQTFKITVPEDDDTCGKELAGKTFYVTLVHYQAEARAWVVKHCDTGAYYFVNHEFFDVDVEVPKEPRLLPVKERIAMQVLFQEGAKTDTGEDVSGTCENANSPLKRGT